jgi:hypothetical protein
MALCRSRDFFLACFLRGWRAGMLYGWLGSGGASNPAIFLQVYGAGYTSVLR